MSAVVFDSDSNVDALVSQMILRPSEEDHDLEIYFRKFANDLTLTDEPINVQSTSNNDDDGGHTPTVPTWLPTSLSMVQGDYYPDSIKSNSKSTPQVTFADSQCTKTALHSFSCDPIAFSPATAHDAFRITFNADCSSNLDVKSNLSSEPISNISAFQSTETEIAASQHHTDDTSTKCSTEYAIESGPGFHHLMPSLSYGDNFPIADVSSCPKNCSDCSQNNIEQWLQPNVTDLFNDSANFITPVLFPADNMQMTAMDQSLRTRWINWNASNPIGSIIPTTTPNSLFHSWASMINPSPAAAPFIKEENLGHVPSTASNGSFSSSSASSSFAVTTIPSDQSLPPIDRKHIDSLPMQGNVQYDCPTNPDSFIGTSNSFKSSHNQRSFFKNHRSFMCGQNFAGNANRIDLRINVEKCFDQLRQLHSETDQVSETNLIFFLMISHS